MALKLVLVFSFYLLNTITPNVCQSIHPTDLKVEYLHNPLAIESAEPRLNWILKEVDSSQQNLTQTAYQILVASTKNLLNNDTADLWDSKKVVSDQSVHIHYKGSQLKSRQQCFWKVKVWDQNDKASDFSSIAKWEMGLLNRNEWTAKWIAAPDGMQHNATLNVADVDSKAS